MSSPHPAAEPPDTRTVLELKAVLDRTLELAPGNTNQIPTGWGMQAELDILSKDAKVSSEKAFCLPPGQGLYILPSANLMVKGIMITSHDYRRGELVLNIMNFGRGNFVVAPGELVGYLSLIKFELITTKELK